MPAKHLKCCCGSGCINCTCLKVTITGLSNGSCLGCDSLNGEFLASGSYNCETGSGRWQGVTTEATGSPVVCPCQTGTLEVVVENFTTITVTIYNNLLAVVLEWSGTLSRSGCSGLSSSGITLTSTTSNNGTCDDTAASCTVTINDYGDCSAIGYCSNSCWSSCPGYPTGDALITINLFSGDNDPPFSEGFNCVEVNGTYVATRAGNCKHDSGWVLVYTGPWYIYGDTVNLYVRVGSAAGFSLAGEPGAMTVTVQLYWHTGGAFNPPANLFFYFTSNDCMETYTLSGGYLPCILAASPSVSVGAA